MKIRYLFKHFTNDIFKKHLIIAEITEKMLEINPKFYSEDFSAMHNEINPEVNLRFSLYFQKDAIVLHSDKLAVVEYFDYNENSVVDKFITMFKKLYKEFK